MTARSLDQLLISSRLASPANKSDSFGMRGQRQLSRSDKDLLEGEIGRGRRAGKGAGGGARPPTVRAGRAGEAGHQRGGAGAGPAPDMRQQAVIKIHYFNHSGGGALAAHARYVARDAARPEEREMPVAEGPVSGEREAAQSEARAHADYLARGEQRRMRFMTGSMKGSMAQPAPPNGQSLISGIFG